MDVIGRFIEDRCVQGSDKQKPTATLYAGYEHWCDNEKEKPIGKTEFGRRLGERGFAEIRIGHDRTRGWRGIGLRHAV